MKHNVNGTTEKVSLTELKIRVQELVYKEKYVILWNHIKQQHPNITEQEILNGLIYGFYKTDNINEGRYISTMKKKTEITENIPVITPEMMEKTALEIAKRRADKKRSPVKGVKEIKCPSCGNSTLSYADDLTFDVTLTGERIVIPNLTGLKCSKCDEVAFDARSTRIIENYTANKPGGGYELNVSTVGGGKLGLYFPKDVLRVMKISKNDKAILTPLSKKKMIIELLNSTA